MKAVMYGAGNIGRGFIGALLSQSGYEVTFIDVAEPVVKALQEDKRYPIRIVTSGEYKDMWVENVTAVNGNLPVAAEVISDCDIMATSVGARVLKYIVPNIVEGLRKRWQKNKAPLNILICENLNNANKVMEELLKAELSADECAIFDKTVGLVEASVGRMVPNQTEEMRDGEALRVCTEQYCFLPVDKAAFKGGVPDIKNLVPYEPFDFYVKRKLFIHNMGHAVCAYLGDILGLEYIYEAISVPEVRIIVQNAMEESAITLARHYGESMIDIQNHISDLLFRFTNKVLKDTCLRVGGDPARKLGPNDRLIGASLLAVEENVMPAYIAVGAACALHRLLKENGEERSLAAAKAALVKISDLDGEDMLSGLILRNYEMINNNCTLAELINEAEKAKHKVMTDVI